MTGTGLVVLDQVDCIVGCNTQVVLVIHLQARSTIACSQALDLFDGDVLIEGIPVGQVVVELRSA